MESLSRPFLPRKLSNATTFSPRNSYDGVFSGHRHNYPGASPIDVQDYREIFANSPAASSIPVLDLSTLREPSSDALNLNLHLNLNFRSSEPDYSKIFGGIRDEDVAVSYEELFARDKARAPSSKTSSSPDSDNLSRHSADALKQFNMSYNKISQKNKDGLDHGTRHVTQLHAIPGFTRFIDEAVPPLMEAKKQDSAAVHVSLDSIKRSKHHPSTVSSPSSSPNNIVDHKDYPKRSTAMNSESCESDASESYFDAEGDANSAASASAAALKKAIEKAQESIRIAKESVGRKKKGLRSFSSKSFKDSLKVEEPKCKDEVRGVFERNTASVSSHVVGRNRKYGDTVVFPDFMDSEKLSVAKRVIDEIHGKFSESTKESLILKDNTIVSNSTQVTHETVEIDISRESNDLTVSLKVEEDEKKVPLESVLSDNEKQEEVLEQEHLKNAEKSDDEASDNIQESKESEGIYHNKLQKDDFEKKQEDNHIGDQKVKTLELDHNVMEEMETHKSCKVDINDNNMETTQEVNDDTEAMKETEDEVIEKTSIDQTSSDDYEDEYEVKSDDTNGSEENDVESESSSSREEEEEEKSQTNIQLPDKETPKIETTKERIDEVAAREREREKDRLAVDRAIREARERARERAERAAVEKATEEIRQRMRADAAKASAQSKLRAERAAVERATSEARQRALEKAMTKKPLQDSSRTSNGTTSESALRSKAKLEKDNRIMERAAKALAEKEKRDLLAQKEEAERNRLAENLDADIKRWSNGKEGNLRALLSTLQYILGGESGWQPIPLTEIIGRSAVKKAYRKATLCVHPDKLQQRGASIQHKYICEKVFDLLKAAWNKFNSEER
ncbi:unnamed protein product [Lactuca virosa]|uniref:J domain-containing protein n=1 Tax=Lactuca virosa TaxID=75947 RepID=A0AAU9M4D9_9ASTR|nr:unnamed protein product [Lactuca virosa]